MSKAPKAANPKDTSAASTSTSVSSSIANAFLQNMNEVTPDGTKTFSPSGSYDWRDGYTGKNYSVPTFTVEQTLSEQQQAIKDQNDRAGLNMATLGADLSGTLGDQLTGNFELGNEPVESRLMELGMKRLDPMFQRRDEDLRTRLANQGIKAGSSAYDREMELSGQQENDAINQLLLSGRGQATQELLTEDNQRINQISALLNGGQVSMPNFMTGANVAGMPVTDNASIIANADQMAASNYAAKQAMIGGTLSGVGGIFAGM